MMPDRDTFQLAERVPALAEYQALRRAVGWSCAPDAVTRGALEASLFAVTALDRRGTAIGMGRLTGDLLYCFACDLVVVPEFQHQRIGRHMLARLVDYALAQQIPTIGLIADDASRNFYQRHRPPFEVAGHFLRLTSERP